MQISYNLLMQDPELWTAEMCHALGRALHRAALVCSVLPEAMPKVCTCLVVLCLCLCPLHCKAARLCASCLA